MKSKKARDSKRWLRVRLWSVGLVFLLAFGVLAGRAVDLQIVQQDRLQQLAQREIMRQVKIAPRRGVIYDRNQEELALSLDTESVYARPLAVAQPKRDGRKLAKVLGAPRAKVVRRLKGDKHFVWVKRRVHPDRAQAVRDLGLEGVGLVTEPKRFYPYTNLACHVLGFAGLDARGLEGLELKYDAPLRGQVQTQTRLRDALGRTFSLSGQGGGSLPEGKHLILTIDKGVQYQVEKILAAAVKRWRAKAGQAVVLLPASGEILAMASVPSFNPNVYQRFDRALYRNRTVTDAFEPGSTFKIFLAAAALKSNKVSLDERFDCERGKWKIGRRSIHDTKPHDKLTLAEIIKVSSNIGAAKVGRLLGAEGLYDSIEAFGFGQLTGVDLPGEAKGILRPARRWGAMDLATISFGQGVAVTPLQLTAAAGAVANGGVLMRPFVVRAMSDSSGRLIKETQPQVAGRPLSPGEAKLLTNMMVAVTEPGGTGTAARVPPFKVAGKTGTAQKPAKGGGYSENDYMSSFLGFVPARDPKAVILVVIDTPQGNHYGGVVAGPAWAAIARVTLEALGVHAENPAPQLLQARTASPGPAPAPRQPPHPPQAAPAPGTAPDLGGLTLRQALALAGKRGLVIRASGWGRVVSQWPAAGRPLKGKTLTLKLSPASGGA